jgi:hypothetical protein
MYYRGPPTRQKGFPMRTQKQIAASRANGRKSQGAVTPEGKARIVAANLQWGIFAEDQVLGWEDQEEFQELKYEYYARHPPASPEARCLLDQIVLCEWHLRRFASVEGSLWDHLFRTNPRQADACAYAVEQGDHTFTRLQHRINSTRRAFHAALKELERLETRDQDVVLVGSAVSLNPVVPATPSPETRLPVLGSLRKNEAREPAAGKTPPRQSRSTSPSAKPSSVSAIPALNDGGITNVIDSEVPNQSGGHGEPPKIQ